MKTSRGKYFDGRSANSVPVVLTLDGPVLRIESEDRILGRWPVAHLFRDETHLVALVVGCGADEQRVEIFDPALLDGILKTSVWSRTRIRKHIWIYAVIFVAVCAFVISAIWHARVFTRYVAGKISFETERALADKIASGADLEACKTTPSQEKAIRKVVDRLYVSNPAGADHVQINFIKDGTRNAFTLPGGRILVYTGLFDDILTPEEFAGVLAHEIEHVEKRHVMESVIRAGLFISLLNLIAGDTSSVLLVDPSTAAQLLGLKMSREMENEADEGALRRLNAGRISSQGMADFFKRVGRGDIPKFLSTHPMTKDRIARFAEQGVATDPEVLTSGEWMDLQKVCYGEKPPP